MRIQRVSSTRLCDVFICLFRSLSTTCGIRIRLFANKVNAFWSLTFARTEASCGARTPNEPVIGLIITMLRDVRARARESALHVCECDGERELKFL